MSRAIAWLGSCLLAAGLGFTGGWMGQPRWAAAKTPAPATQPVNWQRLWNEAVQGASAADRGTQLRGIAMQWAEQQPTTAVAAVQRLPDATERWNIMSDVVQSWARRTPRDATDWVLQLDASPLRTESLLVALRELAAADPQAAVAVAAQLPRREQREQLPRVLVQWAARDLPATMQYIERLDDLPLRNLTLVGIAADYAERDVDAALTWASALPPEQSGAAQRSVFLALVRQDPARAAAMLGILQDAAERRAAAHDIVATWAASDPTAALAWAFQEPLAEERTLLIEAIFKRWCDFDATTASRQLIELQDPLARDAAALAVATNGFVPLALASQAQQLIGADERKRTAATVLYYRLQGYGHDAELTERLRQEAGIAPEDPNAEIHNEIF